MFSALIAVVLRNGRKASKTKLQNAVTLANSKCMKPKLAELFKRYVHNNIGNERHAHEILNTKAHNLGMFFIPPQRKLET